MTTENARKSYDEYTDLGEELEYALRDTQALRAEIERLKRPEMIRELPKEPGFYWLDEAQTWRKGRYKGVVRVRTIFDGTYYYYPQDEEAHPLDTPTDAWWSARPIEPDVIPKEVE